MKKILCLSILLIYALFQIIICSTPVKSSQLVSKSSLKSNNISECNKCFMILENLKKVKSSAYCDNKEIDNILCSQIYYYLYYFKRDFFYDKVNSSDISVNYSPLNYVENSNKNLVCDICSNLDKCTYSDCEQNNNLEMNLTMKNSTDRKTSVSNYSEIIDNKISPKEINKYTKKMNNSFNENDRLVRISEKKNNRHHKKLHGRSYQISKNGEKNSKKKFNAKIYNNNTLNESIFDDFNISLNFLQKDNKFPILTKKHRHYRKYFKIFRKNELINNKRLINFENRKNQTLFLDNNILKKYIDIIAYKIDILEDNVVKIKQLITDSNNFNEKISILRILSNDLKIKQELKTKLNLNLDEKIAFFKSQSLSNIRGIKFDSVYKNLKKKLHQLKFDFKNIKLENQLDIALKKLREILVTCNSFKILYEKIFVEIQGISEVLKKDNKENLLKLASVSLSRDIEKQKKLKKLVKIKKKKKINYSRKN